MCTILSNLVLYSLILFQMISSSEAPLNAYNEHLKQERVYSFIVNSKKYNCKIILQKQCLLFCC